MNAEDLPQFRSTDKAEDAKLYYDAITQILAYCEHKRESSWYASAYQDVIDFAVLSSVLAK